MFNQDRNPSFNCFSPKFWISDKCQPSFEKQNLRKKKLKKNRNHPKPTKQESQCSVRFFKTKAMSHFAQFCQRCMSYVDMSSNMTQTNPSPKINKCNHIDQNDSLAF